MSRSFLIVCSGFPEALNVFTPDNGLANLAACLLAGGHQTHIIDLNVPSMISRYIRRDRPVNVSDMVMNKKIHELSQVQRDDRDHDLRIFYQFGKEISQRVRKEKIDWVGFKLWSGDGVIASEIIAEQIKQLSPEVPIVVGGAHADWMRHHLLEKCLAFDYVSIREGEPSIIAFAEFVDGKLPLQEVPNMISRDHDSFFRGKTERVKDIDTLPLPCYDVAVYPAIKEKILVFNYEDARGCKNRCTFCTHIDKTGYLRTKSPANILSDLSQIQAQCGFSGFRMCSSYTPAHSVNAISQILTDIHSRVPWSALGHVREAQAVDFDMMKRAGCVSLFYGVESASKRILDNVIKKDVDISQIRTALISAKASGIKVIASFIHPCPSEDEQSRRETLALIEQVRPYSVTAYFPGLFPGSTWWKAYKRYGFEVERDTYWVSLLKAKMQYSLPMEIWDELAYTLDKKSVKHLAVECSRFLLEAKTFTESRVPMSDDMVLFSHILQRDPVEYRHCVTQNLIERDVDGLRGNIDEINDRRLKGRWIETDGGS